MHIRYLEVKDLSFLHDDFGCNDVSHCIFFSSLSLPCSIFFLGNVGLSYDDFHNNLIAPTSFRISLLPRPHRINLKHVLAFLADTDAMCWNRAAEQHGEEVVFDGAFWEVRDVECCDALVSIETMMRRGEQRDAEKEIGKWK